MQVAIATLSAGAEKDRQIAAADAVLMLFLTERDGYVAAAPKCATSLGAVHLRSRCV